MILVDTNVLLRLVQPNHKMHSTALAALSELQLANQTLSLVPQVIYEFWVVATRPAAQNGLEMTVTETEFDINKLMQRFRLLRDERTVFERWHELVVRHEVLGKNGHDARLVAAMQRHGLTQILTFNGVDFKRYPDIEVLDPATVVTP